jgi:hypothetical protein
MTAITPAELALLRSRPHETNLWLSIYKPKVMLAAQVNDAAAAPGLMVVTYNNVTYGAYTNIKSGMTMYVGTTPGARDVGRIRVRSATGVAVTVAVNSDIVWADDLFISVVQFWEIDAVYPRMYVPDTDDPTTQIWYKDYDIAYTNQNSALGSLCLCMGQHYAGFMDTATGTCGVYYSATGSSNLRGQALTYYWTFEGGIPATSNALTPGTVNYGMPGHYTTELIMSGTTAGDVSYRHVSIYNRPEHGTSNPILNWEFLSLDGSRDMAGYQARIKIRDNISDVVDGALIVIFADDKYNATTQSIGGNAINRQSIFFMGYVLDNSITYNYEDNSLECTVGSPTEVMKLSSGFGVALNSSADPETEAATDDNIPSAWALLLNMNCGRAMYHYLRWHSTVLYTNDFQFVGEDKNIKYFDSDRESIYDAINNLMAGTLYGEIVCDRQGKIWAEVSMAATDSATGTFPSVMDVTKQDWIGTPSIEETFNYKTGFLEMGGVSLEIVSGSSSAFLSQAPGEWPSYRGGVKRIEGLAVNNQADLNVMCGNVFAYINSKYSHVELDLSGNYRNIDIAPQEIINLSLEATDNPRRITWNKKAFHPTGMSWSYDAKAGTLLPNLTLHEVTQGFDGTTIEIPLIPPITDPGGGGFDVPPIYFPPITWPPFPSTPSVLNWLAVTFIKSFDTSDHYSFPDGGDGSAQLWYDAATSSINVYGGTSRFQAGTYTFVPVVYFPWAEENPGTTIWVDNYIYSYGINDTTYYWNNNQYIGVIPSVGDTFNLLWTELAVELTIPVDSVVFPRFFRKPNYGTYQESFYLYGWYVY